MTASDSNSLVSKDALRNYILHDILGAELVSITDDQDLLISGLLDSISVVRLASYIEESGNIQIPPEDLLLENFGSLNQIDGYLKTRTEN